MFYAFPGNLRAEVIKAYTRPYDRPIAAKAGEVVQIDPQRSTQTDLFGWVWAKGPDGREGWTPEAWLSGVGLRRTLQRDFDAIELSVGIGEQVTLSFSESGFVWCVNDQGQQGWLPDAVLSLTPA